MGQSRLGWDGGGGPIQAGRRGRQVATHQCKMNWVMQIRGKPALEWCKFNLPKQCLKLSACVNMWTIQG